MHGEPAGHDHAHQGSRLALLIERDVAALPADQRSDTLRGLSGLLSEIQGAIKQTVGSGSAEAELASSAAMSDPNSLAARLAALVPSMTPAQRSVAQRQLREAGLLESPAGSKPTGGSTCVWPQPQAKALAENLQHKPDDELDAARVLEATQLLIDFVASLDQLVWTTWKAVAPESAVKRPAPLRPTLTRFVVGDAEPSAAQLKHDLERLRQVTAALTAAVGQAGRQFAQKHVERFSPTEIARAARDEGSWNVEGRCWKKYQQLAAASDVEATQRELMAAVAAYAESLLRGVSGVAR